MAEEHAPGPEPHTRDEGDRRGEGPMGDEAPLEPQSSPGSQLVRGVIVASLCDAVVTVPWALLRRLIKPESIAHSIGILLLATNMLSGYVGGRVAARAGLAHDDARAQWLMAWLVTLGSAMVEALVFRLRPVPTPPNAAAPGALEQLVAIAGAVFLVRFGFAMGTWAQARLEGRVRDDEGDDAG